MTHLWYILLTLLFYGSILILVYLCLFPLFCTDLYLVWLILEIGTVLIVSLLVHVKATHVMMLKLMTLQSISAFLVILGLVLSVESFMLLGLIMKIGLAPFSFWWFRAISSAPLLFIFMFSTFFKIPPSLFVPYLGLNFLNILLVFSRFTILLGSLGGVYTTHPVILLIWSSIIHSGWIFTVLLLSVNTFMIYLIVYILRSGVLYSFIYYYLSPSRNTVSTQLIKTPSFSFALCVLLFSSIPPTPTFFLKLWALKLVFIISPVLACIRLLISGIRLIWYLVWCYQSILSCS